MYRTCGKNLPIASVTRLPSRGLSYTLPTIPLLENLRVGNQNLNGLFSNQTVNELWFKRGQHLIDHLNTLIEQNQIGGSHELNELISLSFHKPELYGVHAYASLLHNLQFFLESVKPVEGGDSAIEKASAESLLKSPEISETIPNEPSDTELRQWIIDSFGSMAEFRTLLLNSAKGIKGDGVTWLVARANHADLALRGSINKSKPDVIYSTLAVMNTYNAGIVDDSIRSGQITKLNKQKAANLALQNKEEGTTIKDQGDNLRLGSIEEAEAATLFSDRKLIPLLAIDSSSRNYLLDYGVFGKQQYLDNLWKCIDWDVVQARAPSRFRQSFDLN